MIPGVPPDGFTAELTSNAASRLLQRRVKVPVLRIQSGESPRPQGGGQEDCFRRLAPSTTIQRPLVWNAMGGRIGNFIRPP